MTHEKYIWNSKFSIHKFVYVFSMAAMTLSWIVVMLYDLQNLKYLLCAPYRKSLLILDRESRGPDLDLKVRGGFPEELTDKLTVN